jgi:protein-tyrosine phosphatase
MRQVAGRPLWLGNRTDLQDVRGVMTRGIHAIVEVADCEPFASLPRELVRCRFPLADGGENPTWLLRLAADTVAALLRAGVPVLVCCSAGLSRSLCVAAAGLALKETRPFSEAITIVAAEGPADVSPALFFQFQRLLGE